MIKLVIDTDGVADDIRAISLALQHPNAQLMALTCVNGCVTVGQAVANVARTLRANNKKVPIYKGAEFPLIGNNHSHVDEVPFFGSDGCGNAPNDFPSVLPTDIDAHEKEHAASFLCDFFANNSDITLVCIGPLTNIALALKLEPKFAKYPKKLVIMGGNIYGAGNVRATSTAEFNFSNDPEAAHIVLKEMQCPIVEVPWESFLFESMKTDVDFHAHLELDIPLARYFRTITKVGLDMLRKSKRQYSYCDEIAVAVAIDPENLIEESKIMRGTVELHGELTRGQIAIDWVAKLLEENSDHPKLCRKRHPITFVTQYNVKYLDKMIFDTIYNSEKDLKTH